MSTPDWDAQARQVLSDIRRAEQQALSVAPIIAAALAAAYSQGQQDTEDRVREPEWADWPAPGICLRGHQQRERRCPACYEMRIDAMNEAKESAKRKVLTNG